MPDTHSSFATMPARQKASAILFFIIGAFILYEVIGMFRGSGGGSSAPIKPVAPAPTQTASMSASAPSGGPGAPPAAHPNPPPTPPSGPAQMNTPPGPPPAVAHGSAITSKPAPEMAPPPPTPYLVQQQQEQVQNHYVEALNDLQLLKIQREMAETNQAIVAAKLATVTAEKSISDMLGPDLNAPSPPPSSKPTTSTNLAPGMPPLGMGPGAGGGSGYVVQSVTMEMDQWHAAISYKDKLYEVSVGDALPPDGSVVSAIDQKGVTLQSGGVEQRLPFSSSDTVAPSSGSPPGPPGS